MTKVMKKYQTGGKVDDSFLAKTLKKRSKLDDYADSAAKWISKKTGIAQSAPKVGKKPMKSGGMLKRADGSYSKRGLWDNIRANKGSGKKPTAQMLKQEKKIKAKTK
jgi:hypothetical protein